MQTCCVMVGSLLLVLESRRSVAHWANWCPLHRGWPFTVIHIQYKLSTTENNTCLLTVRVAWNLFFLLLNVTKHKNKPLLVTSVLI